MASIPAFTWGSNGEKSSPSRVKQYAQIAAALASKTGAPQNVGEGLARIGDALLYNSSNAKVAAGEAEGAASRKAVIDALMGNPNASSTDIVGALGNEWVASDPGSTAVVQALLGQQQQNQAWERQDAQQAEQWAREDNDPLRQLQLQQAQLELEALKNPKPEPGFTLLAPEEAAQLGLPAGVAYQRGPDGKVYDIGGGSTNINVNTGAEAPKLGSLSTDYGYVMDPVTGEVKIDPATGLPTAAAVPGSPAAQEAAALAAKSEMAGDASVRSNDIVATDIDRALNIIDTPGLLPTTGFGADWFSSVGGTAGNDLRNLLNTVKANTAFDTLQAMRASSPTGGALGAVTAPELTLLEAAKGAVEQSQSTQQLKDNLIRLQNVSLDIIHGPGNGPERKVPSFEKDAGAGGNGKPDYTASEPPQGWGGDPTLWRFMSPEDRALW